MISSCLIWERGQRNVQLNLIVAVDEIIVISTTEPTSITDAYSMMKFICLQDPDKTFQYRQ